MNKVGDLNMHVHDTIKGGDTTITMNTHTATNLSKPLFSIAQMYEGGDWDMLLRADNRGGPCLKRFAQDGTATSEIPLRWDYDDHCPYIDHTLRGTKGQIAVSNNPRKRHKRLINTVNNLPSAEIMMDELEKSKIVEALTSTFTVEDEINTTGAKRGMRPAIKKLTQKAFHKSHGHIGTCEGGCDICIRKRGNCFKLYPFDITNFNEWRPGYRWVMDCITWSHKSARKEKYSFVLRDIATGYFKVFNTMLRSDFVGAFVPWVNEMRTNSHMKAHIHTIIAEIHCDFDGVFREDSTKFTDAIKELGINVTYVPVEHHEGPGERAMGIFEETVKGLLMERNLPPEWWSECALAAEFLLNRFALTRDTSSSDGDAIRPIEKMTAGSYSRRRVDRELSYYLGPGTLALVYDARVKGSDVSAKVRFGVACGMISDIVLFKCPYTHSKFRSKSYTVIQLPSSISFSQFLNLPTPKNNNCMPTIKDININIKEKQSLSSLPAPRAWEEDRLRDIKFLDRINYSDEECLDDVDIVEKTGGGRKYDMLVGEGPKDEGGGDNNPSPSPTTNTDKQDTGKRKRYKVSTETTMKLAKGALPQADYEGTGEFYVGRKISKEFEGVMYRGVVTNCDCDYTGGKIWEVTYEDMDIEDLYHCDLMKVLLPEENIGGRGTKQNKNDNAKISPRMYTSSSTDTFPQICKERFELKNVEEMKMYLDCLDESLRKRFNVNFSKRHRRTSQQARDYRVGEGLHFPFPEDVPKFVATRDALWKSNFRETPTKMMEESLAAASIIARRRKRREKDVFSIDLNREEAFLVEKSSGKILAPERVQDAIDRDDLELWLTAWNEELEGLSMDGEHISHNHTLAEVKAMGIGEPPLPTRMISAAKYRGVEFDRRKGRMICQGFRAIEGVHHDGKSFAASPSQHTQKLIMSFVAGKDYEVLSWDIKTAYLFGERVKPVCMSYPAGFRRERDGEPLYMVARRGHYGEVNAGRMWAETRTKKIRQMYNTKH